MVKGAVKLALDLGMPALIVGLTVVAITTSLPELFASVAAQVVGGEGDVALGNVVGSNIANLGLVLGLALLIRPMHVPIVIKKREMPIVFAASLLLFIVMLPDSIGRIKGLILLFGMVAYTVYQLKIAREEENISKQALQQETIPKLSLWREICLVIIGVILLIFGASLLVKGAVAIAKHFGLSELVIGVTIVAIGSSLPEIATVVVAAIKKRTDLILGNVFGSNIYNITMVASIASLVRPIKYSPQMLYLDIPVMLGITVLVWGLVHFCKTLNRWHGALLLALYVLYLASL